MDTNASPSLFVVSDIPLGYPRRPQSCPQVEDDCMHWLMALLGFPIIVALADEPCMAGANSELSSLRGTYWRLEHVDNATEETSNVVVRITGSLVDFSAPPCHFRRYPFDYRYRPGSLSVSGAVSQRSCLSRKWQVGGAVEANLHRINDYVLSGDDLTFLDGRGGPVMRLHADHS
jgi:hypothetical protein